MGLSDQKMALDWVQKNIWRFKGRPTEVTVIGHEAGAACVGIHMLSPISRELQLLTYLYQHSALHRLFGSYLLVP